MQMPPTCDIVIRDALIVEARQAPRRASVGVRGGEIVAVWAGAVPPSAIAHETHVVDAADLYLLPGLINAHSHLFQMLLRGLGDELSGGRWFRDMMLPAAAALQTEDAEVAAAIGSAEALLSGVTTVFDFMQVHTWPGMAEAVLRGMRSTGIRARYGRGIVLTGESAGMPPSMVESIESAIEDCEALLPLAAASGGLVSIAVAPYAVWALSEAGARRAADWAADHGISITVHASESRSQVQDALDRFGMTDLAWLERVGLLTQRTSVIHAVQVDEAAIECLQASGASVVHCPVANLYGGSGVAPVPAMRQAGIRVALGTDGAASNNSQNLFETLKFASLVQKGIGADGIGADEALAMATSEGADALGLGGTLGRIAPGYRADLVLIDPSRLPIAPHHHPVSDVVYAATPMSVDRVFVDGQPVVEHGGLTRLDLGALLKVGQERADALVGRARLSHHRQRHRRAP
jgi:5-methylthioadenosine/S-adenosylhomocysteine deaminase